MGQRARVTSIDAVDDFAAALRCFQHDASRILEALELGIHRAVQWIQEDQKQYWKQQLRRSDQKVQEAKLALERCLIFKGGSDQRAACVEEKRALERAKRRHQLCREKLETVRRWSRDIERAVFEYKAGVGELRQWLETDAARTLGLLERITQTLQEYVLAESSPQVAEALARLPWTDEQWEKLEQRSEVADKDSCEEPGRAADATDGRDLSRGHEHGSEEEASS
jgi:hypothetical protein